MIIKSFNSPSLILSKIQESSDLGWREDEEKSIFISSFGNIQIIFNDEKNEIEINPIEETLPHIFGLFRNNSYSVNLKVLVKYTLNLNKYLFSQATVSN